jgi:hypothetical protein
MFQMLVILANGQTSTIFKYGTSSDVYSIFAFAMAVDSYIPEPEGIIMVLSTLSPVLRNPIR